MNTQERLIAALRARFPGESDSAIARHAGLSPQRFSNYSGNLRRMDDDAVIGCALALELDPARVVADHRADLAKTPRERTFWRRWSAAATLAAVALFPTPQASAAAHENVSHVMHYAKKLRRRIAAMLTRRLVGWSHGPAPVLA